MRFRGPGPHTNANLRMKHLFNNCVKVSVLDQHAPAKTTGVLALNHAQQVRRQSYTFCCSASPPKAAAKGVSGLFLISARFSMNATMFSGLDRIHHPSFCSRKKVDACRFSAPCHDCSLQKDRPSLRMLPISATCAIKAW